MQSLKERFEAKKVQQLKERASRARKQLLAEAHASKIIIEAMDQEDLDKVSGLVQKLNRIKDAAGQDLGPLTSAIDQAQAEINKFTAGGPIAKAWTTLKQKVGIDNPIVKVTTFANALERGFQQLPQILKNNGIDAEKLKQMNPNEMTLANAIAQQFVKSEKKLGEDDGNSPTRNSGPPTINTRDIEAGHKAETSGEAQKRTKSVITQLQKALAPTGIFGAFKKVPYVDSAALAAALANTHISTLIKVSNAVKTGTQSSEIAQGLKQNVVGKGDSQTQSTQPSAESQPTSQSQPSDRPKPSTSTTPETPTGQTPPQGPGEKRGGGKEQGKSRLDDKAIKDLANFISKKSGVDASATLKILAALNDSEKLRS